MGYSAWHLPLPEGTTALAEAMLTYYMLGLVVFIHWYNPIVIYVLLTVFIQVRTTISVDIN